jgi:hypothetical protein
MRKNEAASSGSPGKSGRHGMLHFQKLESSAIGFFQTLELAVIALRL